MTDAPLVCGYCGRAGFVVAELDRPACAICETTELDKQLPPARDGTECDGYAHPFTLVRQSRDGEWSCIGCGVVLV